MKQTVLEWDSGQDLSWEEPLMATYQPFCCIFSVTCMCMCVCVFAFVLRITLYLQLSTSRPCLVVRKRQFYFASACIQLPKPYLPHLLLSSPDNNINFWVRAERQQQKRDLGGLKPK